MQFWFALAMLTALFWGLSSVFAKLSTPRLGVARVAALIVIIESIAYSLGFFFWHSNVAISVGYAFLAAASAFVGVAAYLCFFESVLDGQIAIVGTISAAYPSLTVIGALAFLAESLTVTQLFAIGAIICGIIALSYESNPHSTYAVPRRSLLFALSAFALWGLWSLTAKIVVSKIGAGDLFGFYVISTLTVPSAYMWFRRRALHTNTVEPSLASWTLGATGLALNVCGTLAFTFALSVGFASLVAPISSAYPVVTVIAALLLLREKLNRLQVVALCLVIAGLLVIAAVG